MTIYAGYGRFRMDDRQKVRLKELRETGQQMRHAQRKYFDTRNRNHLV